MKLLIVTPHFYPENFKCNDMAFELRKRGHEVSVMTAIPDYPLGKFFKGYGIFKKRKECINGIKVHRSLIVPRGSGSSIRLAINYVSYTFFASLKAVYFGLAKRYDAVIIHETSPVMVGIPGAIIKRMQNIPMFFWVLDLWPESLTAAGGISNGKVLMVFNNLTRWLYRNSDKILIGSKGYRKSINEKGDFDDKIHYFPNWVEDVLSDTKDVEVPNLPEGFNVMIAGNMGDAQDIPHILESALDLKDYNINFIFVGNGRKRPFVEEFIKEHGLEKKVFCLGCFPLASMPSLFNKADVLFFALKNSPIFSLTVPSRLQAYMSSGKPVVAMINGEGREVIEEADCGWSVPAEDAHGLSELLKNISEMDCSVLIKKGENGKKYSSKNYSFKTQMDYLEKLLNIMP